VDSSVTHLICSTEGFKSKLPKGNCEWNRHFSSDPSGGSADILLPVKAALKLGSGCHIVDKDWLEDSIKAKRKLREKDFSLKEIAREKRRKQMELLKVKQNREAGQRFVDLNLFKIYRDSTFFEYKVYLTRRDYDKSVTGERWEMYLFQSHQTPHLYHFAAKYFKKSGAKPLLHRPRDTEQTFPVIFKDWSDFFKDKTGVVWDERLVAVSPPQRFVYQKPTGGKPVGIITDLANYPKDPQEFSMVSGPLSSQPITVPNTPRREAEEPAEVAYQQVAWRSSVPVDEAIFETYSRVVGRKVEDVHRCGTTESAATKEGALAIAMQESMGAERQDISSKVNTEHSLQLTDEKASKDNSVASCAKPVIIIDD
jgi:hypothetical protein